jgi:hypothetical protein
VLESPDKVTAWLNEAEFNTSRELFFLNKQDELVVDIALEQGLVLFSMALHCSVANISICINIIIRVVDKVEYIRSDGHRLFAVLLWVLDGVSIFVNYPRFVQVENLDLIAQSFIAHKHVFGSKFTLVEYSINLDIITEFSEIKFLVQE